VTYLFAESYRLKQSLIAAGSALERIMDGNALASHSRLMKTSENSFNRDGQVESVKTLQTRVIASDAFPMLSVTLKWSAMRRQWPKRRMTSKKGKMQWTSLHGICHVNKIERISDLHFSSDQSHIYELIFSHGRGPSAIKDNFRLIDKECGRDRKEYLILFLIWECLYKCYNYVTINK